MKKEVTAGAGSILVGLAVILAASGWNAASAGRDDILPEPGFPQSVGMVAFFLPNLPGEVDQFLATGVKVWRRDFRWVFFETEMGKYDFSAFDKDLERVAPAGVRMLFILWGTNPLYPGYGDGPEYRIPTDPQQYPGFAAFAAAAATHFRDKPVMFELGNEPDGSGGPSPEKYMAWVDATVQAMRQADPNVVIVGPGAHEWARPWIEQLFQLGFLNLVDAVSVHLYLGGDWKIPQRMPESHEKEGRIASLKQLIAKYGNGRNIPILDTEWGYRTYHTRDHEGEDDDMQVSVQDQARYMARSMLLCVLWDVRVHTWFAWWLPTTDSGGYCVIDETRMPLPGYYALKNLTEQLPDSTLRKRIDVGSPDDYVLEFATSQGTRWAAWTCAADHAIAFPVEGCANVVVTDLCGTRSWELPVEQGNLNLGISGAVLYLKPAP